MKLILACLVYYAYSTQIPPVPPRPDGIAYGPSTTNYTLDVFYDHLCTDSAAAFPGLYSYWEMNQSWLRMVIHIFPLPYHYYSFEVGIAGRFIQLNYPSNFTSFTSWMFQHQSKYLDAARQWDQTVLYTYLAADTSTATGVPSGLVESALYNPVYSEDLKVSWKYVASNGITGTPRYMVNGIFSPPATFFETVADWENFFNSLAN